MVPCPIIHFSHIQYKKIHLSIFAFLTLSVSEEDESIGLSRAEANVRLWSLKGDWVQCGHILTFVGHLTLDFHLWIQNPSHPGQLQTDVIVLVHHL
uniref:Uncharacterized protein n=1 Tax=Xiphophorus maculatus TaxID=8083 RepID=A0A3B5QVS1_XIPMA